MVTRRPFRQRHTALAALAPPPQEQALLQNLSHQKRATPDMVQALQNLRAALECPLCHGVLQAPSTLPCAHSFCQQCIDIYTCNAWECPVPGCGMPISVRGERDGSFRRINPSLQTVVTSWHTICHALQRAEPEWWKTAGRGGTPDPNETPEKLAESTVAMIEQLTAKMGVREGGAPLSPMPEEGLEDEEVVDLQT